MVSARVSPLDDRCCLCSRETHYPAAKAIHRGFKRKSGPGRWFKEDAAQNLALKTVVNRLPPGSRQHTLGPVENINNCLNRQVVNRDHMSHDISLIGDYECVYFKPFTIGKCTGIP